ncbi:MAG: hypothetical protein ABSE62_00790 [Chthoniobacteraceae bacterium]
MRRPLVTEKRMASQPSWVVRTGQVELAVTRLGAHMAPVTFCRDEREPVQPYYISPWHNEKIAGLVPVLVPLRGDFACLPFGANEKPWRGEKHPPHGEISGNEWALEACSRDEKAVTLQIHCETKVRPGIVRRAFTLIEGHNAVYCRTIVEGFAGKAPYAHHAILRTDGAEKMLLVSTSKFQIGRTNPAPPGNPADGEYQSVALNVPFRSLDRVPSIYRDQPPCDCSAYPARPGFCDLIQQFERPAKKPSWVAAVNVAEHWMWFALKDPAVMPGRLFWIENRGRHAPPWNGRNSCLGIEDGCMYFAEGVADSCGPNPISGEGIPTCLSFPGDRAVEIRYIQGAARVPRGFDRVDKIDFVPGAAKFYSKSGKSVAVPLDHGFLFGA